MSRYILCIEIVHGGDDEVAATHAHHSKVFLPAYQAENNKKRKCVLNILIANLDKWKDRI